MANESDSVSSEMKVSLKDLSMEMEALGLKPLVSSRCSSKSELCESLLSTAWMLINLVHCSSLGLNQSQNALDREALLLSEKQSLESKLSYLKSDVNLKEIALIKERENLRRTENELKKHNETIQKHKHLISQQSARLEAQERDFKNAMREKEVQNEHLRDIVRKTLGVGLRSPIYAEKLSNAFGSMAVSSGPSGHTQLQESSLNRLKSVNHTLVGENLMLRDALQMLHLDIYNVLESAEKISSVKITSVQFEMPANIFRLPLSYCMNKIKSLRQEQVIRLHQVLQQAVTKP